MPDPLLTITKALPGFLDYMRVERRFSPQTVKKYQENISWVARDIGDVDLEALSLSDVISLKARMQARGAQESRVGSVIAALKSLLGFVRDVRGASVIDLKSVRAPRGSRREVVYLTSEELKRFVEAIALETPWSGRARIQGHCCRALVETLAATAMRISEALALNRDSIDFEKREARIIGKGNKERTVFFTLRAIEWIQRYLALRSDAAPALFLASSGSRLRVSSVDSMFRRLRSKAGLEKPVTPHMLRHTAATNLLQNGCPLGHIKEVLGHERLETTCRFYLGMLNKAEIKKAFDSYMVY